MEMGSVDGRVVGRQTSHSERADHLQGVARRRRAVQAHCPTPVSGAYGGSGPLCIRSPLVHVQEAYRQLDAREQEVAEAVQALEAARAAAASDLQGAKLARRVAAQERAGLERARAQLDGERASLAHQAHHLRGLEQVRGRSTAGTARVGSPRQLPVVSRAQCQKVTLNPAPHLTAACG